MTKTVAQVFQSSDGKTHSSLVAAERHNELLEAKQAFEEAGRRAVKALGATAVTADGQPFDMRHSRDYWFISMNYLGGLPRFVKVWLWPHNAEIETDRDSGQLSLREYNHDRREHITYRINELYFSQEAAKIAYRAACEKRLEELTAEVEALA